MFARNSELLEGGASNLQGPEFFDVSQNEIDKFELAVKLKAGNHITEGLFLKDLDSILLRFAKTFGGQERLCSVIKKIGLCLRTGECYGPFSKMAEAVSDKEGLAISVDAVPVECETLRYCLEEI